MIQCGLAAAKPLVESLQIKDVAKGRIQALEANADLVVAVETDLVTSTSIL